MQSGIGWTPTPLCRTRRRPGKAPYSDDPKRRGGSCYEL